MNKDTSPEKPLSLAADFPAASDAQWRRLVDKVLAGADFDKKLIAHGYDGLAIKPLYTRADWSCEGDPSGVPGAAPFTRGGTPTGTLGGWDVRQMHANAAPERANANILEDLAGGVTSITLKVDPTGAHGAAVRTLADLDRALKDVFLDAAPVALDTAGSTLGPAALLMQLVTQRGAAGEFAGNFGLDELGAFAATGGMTESLLPALADAAAFVATTFPRARAINVRGIIYHSAGASNAQELGAALASAVAYLRALTAAGMDIDAACRQIAFTLAADADFFMVTAKFRALRKIFARAADVAGASPASRAAPVTAVTAPRMMTQRDPWVNVLRGTIAGFAAGIAGADALTVLPLDHALGEPSALARRIARNTQIVLIEEAGLARVIDPAGGAWLFERLTDELAEKAWEFFRDIERKGGMAAALSSGFVAESIAKVVAERARNIARRKDPITGVSEYPDLAERAVAVEPRGPVSPVPSAKSIGALPHAGRGVLTKALLSAASQGANVASIEAAITGKLLTAPALKPARLAEGFEALRDASDGYLATHGARPKVFLANIGAIADFTARATFARNFFEAGGIAAVPGPGGFGAAIVDDFKASGAKLAVICGSDAQYKDHAGPLAGALRMHGASVYLAGRPGEQEAALRATGIDGFIYMGCDVLKTLSEVHRAVGLAP